MSGFPGPFGDQLVEVVGLRAVNSRIAKSSRIRTAGRVSREALSQVRSACPPARSARMRLVLMNRTSAP